VEQLGLEFSRASTKAVTVSNLPTVSRDDFLNFEKEVKVSLGMKKIRLLKLKTTDSVGATVHSSSISSDDFIDFDKDIVEKMGMKKIRLLKVITPKPTTISPVTVTTSSENPKTVKTQSSSKHAADDIIAIPERLVTEKSISVEEDVSDSSLPRKRIVTLAPPSTTSRILKRKIVRPTVTFPPLFSDDTITSTIETSSSSNEPISLTIPPSIEADLTSFQSNKFSSNLESNSHDAQFVSNLEINLLSQSHTSSRNSKVFNGDPTQRVTLSPVSLLKVAIATVPVTEKDDSFVHFNSIPRSPKFFNSEPSRDFLVPTAKVSRIVNDNGRIHLVNVESDKSRIGGGLIIRYQLPAHLSPTAKISPVLKSISRLPRTLFS